MVPDPYEYKYILFVVLAISAAYFVHIILYFGVTGQFEMANEGIGPSEIRILVIVLNTMLIYLDRIIFVPLLLAFLSANIVLLLVSIYRAQRKIWIWICGQNTLPIPNTASTDPLLYQPYFDAGDGTASATRLASFPIFPRR